MKGFILDLMKALLLPLLLAASQCEPVQTAIERPTDQPEFVATTACVDEGWTITIVGTPPSTAEAWHVIVGYDYVSGWTTEPITYVSPVTYWPEQPAANIPMQWKVNWTTDPATQTLVTVPNPGC